MGGYQPYLIGNIRHGLELGVSPWLLPSEAYSSMVNCYLRRGVVTKRNGRQEFGRIPHAIDDESIGASGSTVYSGTISNIPAQPFSISFTDGSASITDDGNGVLSGDGSGTINYSTGVYSVTFSSTTTGPVVVDYSYYPSFPVVGIEPHHDAAAGTSGLIVFDTKRAAKYDENLTLFIPIEASDIWTGDSSNLIWGANYQSRLFVTNNKDRAKYYDGIVFYDLMMDIDGDSINDIDTCLLLFSYKERIVALRTTENGIHLPQRARWCTAGQPDDWTNDGFVDCPTQDWIMAADFIKDDLIVFFQYSTWKLRYTADADLPFRWEQISSIDGGLATFSGFNFSDEIGIVGATNINATDGLRVYSIDDKIPDSVGGIDHNAFDKIYAIVTSELEQALISYQTVGATANDRSLCYNYKDRSFSYYDFGFNCYGYYKVGQSGTILDDITDVLDTIEYSFDDVTIQAGYPTTIAGDLNGYIWTINSGLSDNGQPISIELLSGRWNPYIKEGRQARLGFVDLLVERNPNTSIDVDFYINHDPVKYLTQSVQCGESDSEEDMVWIRVYAEAVGSFHRMRISHNSQNSFKLHAVNAWFKPAGPIG